MRTIFLSLFIGVFLCACSSINRYNIYHKIPKGTELTKDLLSSSTQVIPIKSELIVIWDSSDDILMFDPHLLFYDEKLTLKSACYYASERVEKIENNVIIGYLNESRYSRKNRYARELPQEFKVKLKKHSGFSGSKTNRAIEKITIDPSDFMIKLFVKESKSYHVNIPAKSEKYFESFVKPDTLNFHLSNITFNIEDGSISIRKLEKGNKLIWEDMPIADESILTRFFDDLFDIFSTQIRDN